MEVYNTLSQTEKRILWASSALFCICLFLLSPLAEDFLFSLQAKKPTTEVVGEIISQQNDTLHRYKSEYFWRQAKQHEEIHLGDSIYSGPNSQVEVEIKSRKNMTVGENSLIIFDLVEAEKTADFQFGNFSLKVNGTIKVAIQGEMTEFTGNDSEIQVYTDANNQAKARVLKGEITAKNKRTGQQKVAKGSAIKLPKRSLVKRTTASLPKPPQETPTEAPQPIVLKPQIKPPPMPPIVKRGEPILYYTWKLEDHFEAKGNQLVEKPYSPHKVALTHTLSWFQSEDLLSFIEISDEPKFTRAARSQPAANSFLLKQVFVGDNYWRASQDGKLFSPTETFKVEGRFATEATPKAATAVSQVPLVEASTRAIISLQTAAVEPLGFVVQASHDLQFKNGETMSFWSGKKDVTVSFYKPGAYFYRFKTVTKNRELSTWSQPLAFTVFAPKKPEAPRLASGKIDVPLNETLFMNWKSSGVSTRVEIYTENGKKIKDFVGLKTQWKSPIAGKFKARAWTVNMYGQESPPSKTIPLNVQAPPQPKLAAVPPKEPPKPEPTPQAKPAEPVRKTAAVESTVSIKAPPADVHFQNDHYNSAEVSVNGFLWTAYSSEQYYNSEANPVASGIGLHGTYWRNHHGVEGSYKSGVLGLNDTGTSQASLKDLEVRYHYRFITSAPWSYSRELQLSVFGGLENYQNSGGSFASQYNLIKFGTSVEFPWSSKWSSGGEFVFGTAADNSQKKEISGHLGYFLNPNWSLGAGYRVHLFDAGSVDTAPKGNLPYREGYGEGYSLLKYHF